MRGGYLPSARLGGGEMGSLDNAGAVSWRARLFGHNGLCSAIWLGGLPESLFLRHRLLGMLLLFEPPAPT